MAYVLSSVSGNLISAASAGYAPTNSADVSAIASAYQVVSATATQLYAGTAYITSVNAAPISAARAGNAANASMANSAYYDGTGRLISSLPDEATVSSIASAYAESAASGKLDKTAQVVSATGTELYNGTYYLTSVNDNQLSAKYAVSASSATAAFYARYDRRDGVVRYLSSLPGSAEVSAIASSYVESGVSSKQDTLSFAYNTADQISSINGSALGGMDEAAVSGIASAYAESAVSGKADSSALSSYVPYSGLEYNTASAISGINGSALAAGSTYSAGEGIDITDDVISVEAPVDIVAGPGIVIDNPDGNTLRVSMASDYEVTLWENSSGTRTTSGSLSEPMSHFEYIEFYSINNDYQCLPATRYHVNSTFLSNISGQLGVSMGGICFNNNGTPLIKAAQIKATDSSWSIATTVDYVLGNTSKTTDMNRCWPSKIVGIHRIANN